MTEPKELQITQALKARLSEIRTAAGYYTDAGERVYLGRRLFTDDDIYPALTIAAEEADPIEQSPVSLHLELSVAVQGIVRCDPDNPEVEIARILADIKRAVFRPEDPTLGRLVRKIEYAGRGITHRAEGSDIGAGVIELTIDYTERLQQ